MSEHEPQSSSDAIRVAVVVGNPKPRSRTLMVASRVADELVAGIGSTADIATVDLADCAHGLFDLNDERVNEQLSVVACAEVIVVASPTYKATYTGLLKSFFDRYGNEALGGSVAVPVMVAASPAHALAVELHLRPLLVELGASIPTRGVFVLEQQLDDLDEIIAAWARGASALVSAVVKALPSVGREGLPRR